mmetsp:Transcript_9841/g.22722  ORF Transcript_9841/g.22722 Transcript_9841/m.22722 type:complete len:223 (+) Transcript_9841:635-1303(+)
MGFETVVIFTVLEPGGKPSDNFFFPGVGGVLKGRQRNSAMSANLDMVRIASLVSEALSDRTANGSLLEWLRQEDTRFVGVSFGGGNNIQNKTLLSDLNLNFQASAPSEPVFSSSRLFWSPVQFLGSALFAITLVATGSLCFFGYKRYKHRSLTEDRPTIHHEDGVTDLLMRSVLVQQQQLTLTRANLRGSPMIVSMSRQLADQHIKRHNNKMTLAHTTGEIA